MPTKGTQIRYSISNSHCFNILVKFNRYSDLQSALDLIFILKGQIGRMMQIKLAKLKKVQQDCLKFRMKRQRMSWMIARQSAEHQTAAQDLFKSQMEFVST